MSEINQQDMLIQVDGKVEPNIKKIVIVDGKLANVITNGQLVNIDDLKLCDNIECDNGMICTGKQVEDGRFEIVKCPKCHGRGFRKK